MRGPRTEPSGHVTRSPALNQTADGAHDVVYMTRLLRPIDVDGKTVLTNVKPYVDQQLNRWREVHLDPLRVKAMRVLPDANEPMPTC